MVTLYCHLHVRMIKEYQIYHMIIQQVEGAAEEDGRTPSIWDVFAHAGLFSSLYVSLNSWRIWQDVYIYSFTAGHSGVAAGNVACDQYHKYKVTFLPISIITSVSVFV